MSWPLIKIPTICRPRQWPTIPKTDLLTSGFPVYGANGQIGYYSEYNHENPTVLITCRGATCGTINICEPKSYVTGNAMALDDLDQSRADVNFIIRALENTDFSSVITGVAQPQITRQSLSRLEIPLPPLAEQKRIAAILDAADALRAKRCKSLEQLDTLLQSTFLEMFGDPVTNPMGWESSTIGEVTTCLDRFRKPVKADERVTGRIPYYGANGQQGWINKAIFDETLVLVAEDGGHFESPERGVSYRIDGPSWVNNHAHVLRPSDKVEAEYLHRSLRHYDFRPYISGSTRAKLNQKQLNKAKILLPPLDLQNRFAAIVESVEQQRAAQRKHLEELDTLFASLQQRAFSGEL